VTTRKQFVAAAAVSATSLVAVPAVAQTTPTGAAPPKSKPSPSPKPATEISPAARDLAQSMRTFEPQLTDEQIETIAGGIQGNLDLGRRVNPHGTLLKNWNEPATIFKVDA
jgi:hypothetical protein